MTSVNNLLSSVIFVFLTTGGIRAQSVDLKYVRKIYPLEKDTTDNLDQFCGWSSEEELSSKCRELVEPPNSKFERYEYLRRQSPGRTQTYVAVKMGLFKSNVQIQACRCPTEPAIYLQYRSSPESDEVVVYAVRSETPSERRPSDDSCANCEWGECAETSCKVLCCPCTGLVYTCAAIDYGIGRCCCGPNYATKP